MAKRSSFIKSLLLVLCMSLSVPAHAGWWEDLQAGVQKYWKQISFAVVGTVFYAWLVVKSKKVTQTPASQVASTLPVESSNSKPSDATPASPVKHSISEPSNATSTSPVEPAIVLTSEEQENNQKQSLIQNAKALVRSLAGIRARSEEGLFEKVVTYVVDRVPHEYDSKEPLFAKDIVDKYYTDKYDTASQSKQAYFSSIYGTVNSVDEARYSWKKFNYADHLYNYVDTVLQRITMFDKWLKSKIDQMKKTENELNELSVVSTEIDMNEVSGNKIATFAVALNEVEKVHKGLVKAIDPTKKIKASLLQFKELQKQDVYTSFFKAVKPFLQIMDCGNNVVGEKVQSHHSIEESVRCYNRYTDDDYKRGVLEKSGASLAAYQQYVTDAEQDLARLEDNLQKQVNTLDSRVFDYVKIVPEYGYYMNAKNLNKELLPKIQCILSNMNAVIAEQNAQEASVCTVEQNK